MSILLAESDQHCTIWYWHGSLDGMRACARTLKLTTVSSADGTKVQMASIVRIAVPVISIFASGWLLRDPMSIPSWQIGLGLLLAGFGAAWIYLHQS
jgi:hypothetical protein